MNKQGADVFGDDLRDPNGFPIGSVYIEKDVFDTIGAFWVVFMLTRFKNYDWGGVDPETASQNHEAVIWGRGFDIVGVYPSLFGDVVVRRSPCKTFTSVFFQPSAS